MKSARVGVTSAKLIGYIGVNNLELDLTSPRTWRGEADVVLPGVIEVKDATMGISNGRLTELAADLHFAQPLPISLFQGTGLYRVAFSWLKNPPTIGGGIGLQAGPTLFGFRPITADGDFVARFPGASQSPGFRVDGDVKVMNVQLGEAYVDYTHPKALDVAGCLGDCTSGFKLGPAKVIGYVEGKVRSGNSFAFQVEGGAEAGMNWNCKLFNWDCGVIDIAVLGKAILSNVGAAVCGGVKGWSTDWTAGVGYKWSGEPKAFTGCDLGPYRSIKNAQLLAAPGEHAHRKDVVVDPHAGRRGSVRQGVPLQGQGRAPTGGPAPARWQHDLDVARDGRTARGLPDHGRSGQQRDDHPRRPARGGRVDGHPAEGFRPAPGCFGLRRASAGRRDRDDHR